MHRFLRFALCLATGYLSQSTYAAPITADFSGHRAEADSIPPVITCPPSNIFQLGPDLCGQVVQYSVTATDDLPGVIVAQAGGVPSGSTFPVGVTVNTFLALDVAGNTATCSFTITVLNFSNTLICNDLATIKIDNDCSYPVPPTDILELNANGCSAGFVVEVDRTVPFGNGPWAPAVMTMADLNKTYQFRVTAPVTGNRCWGNGVVRDSLPPTLQCTDINISCAVSNLAPAYLHDSLGLQAGQPVALDNCGGTLTLGYTEVVVNLPCDTASSLSGTLTRTWTAQDASQNQKSCVQKINRRRLLADVQIPADRIMGCTDPNISQLVNGVPFVAVGGVQFPLLPSSYCETDASYFDTIMPQCGGSYRVRRTWKVYDLCLPLSATNPKIGVQNIDIQDVVGPVLQCPPATTVTAIGPGCQGNIRLPDVVITDGCSDIATFAADWTDHGGGQLAGTLTNWPGNDPALSDTLGVLDSLNFPTGLATIRYTATDVCGNTGSCSFSLIVTDTLPPTVTCFPFLTVKISPSGSYQVGVDTLYSLASDLCTPLAFKVRRSLPNPCYSNEQFDDAVAFCCSDIGDTVALTLRVYDVPMPVGAVGLSVAAAYASACTVQVRVIDPNPPQCTAPPDTVVTCEDFDATLASYGNLITRSCGVETVQILADYTQFDTFCHRGQVLRVFQVGNAAGQSGQCTQQITVDYRQNYFIRFPNDVVTASCDASGSFGEPIYSGLDCERMQATYTDQVFTVVPDACFKIERTWKIINLCQYDSSQALTNVPNPNPNLMPNALINLVGPTVSASTTTGTWAPTLSKINPGDSVATNFSIYWAAGTNGYKYKQSIKVVDTQAPFFVNCPTAAPTFADSSSNSDELWNEPFWFDPTTGLRDLSDASTVLSATASDACRGVTLHYTLFLDLDGNGEPETVVRSTQLPGFNTVNFNNAFNTNYSGGTPRTFDERPVISAQKYGFAMQTAVVNNKKTAWVRWNTSQAPMQYSNPQLPRGQHKILWTATDSCGNTATCQYNFTIRDGLPPISACGGVALTRNIAPNQMLSLDVNEISQAATDNYTPSQQLQYAIRRPGTGSGYPLDSLGNPNRMVKYYCADLGSNNLQLWVRDQDNNVSFCTLPVVIQDPNNICSSPLINIAGSVKTALDTGLSEVLLNVYATFPGLLPASFTTLSDSAGHFVFPTGMPAGTTYALTPAKDGNALNGVSTYDLVLMSRHILGLQAITSPYKLIAADANKSNSVTSIDIVELRRLILGIYPVGLPLLPAWRFVDGAFVFPNPANPFLTPFPETRMVDSLVAGQVPDNFVGIKIGDVDCSAIPSVAAPAEDRGQGTLWFGLNDRLVRAGDTVVVTFRAAEAVAGYQFTLEYPGLDVLEVQPGADMHLENFAVFADRQALTTSFDAAEDGTLFGQPAAFQLRFRARQTGRLSQMLHLSGRITPAEAYRGTAVLLPLGVGLRFSPAVLVGSDFELLPSTPNPFSEQTSIRFRLPEATSATLTIYDAAGQLRYTMTADYVPGLHTVKIHKNELGAGGMLFYRLQTATQGAAGKLLMLR